MYACFAIVTIGEDPALLARVQVSASETMRLASLHGWRADRRHRSGDGRGLCFFQSVALGRVTDAPRCVRLNVRSLMRAAVSQERVMCFF